MTRSRVSIVGFGTIGKRLADYINELPNCELVGIYKQTPDVPLKRLYDHLAPTLKVYCPPNQRWLFEARGIAIAGNLFHLCEQSDIILDCSPAGSGEENLQLYYSKYDLKVIFQGGEANKLVDQMFFSRINFEEARSPSKRFFKIPSCNTTGILRTVQTFPEIARIVVTLLRRGADLKDPQSGPIASIRVSSIPSHHSEDVRFLHPSIKLQTIATVVCSNLCHLQSVQIELNDRTISKRMIIDRLKQAHRTVFTGFDGLSTAEVLEWGRDQQRNRGDVYENIVFRSFDVTDGHLIFFQAIHQESITVPETLECLLALTTEMTQAQSEAFVDQLLAIKH